MGIISFLGGTAFRWIVGEIVGFMKAKQEHQHEQAMVRLNMEVAAHNAELRRLEIQAAADAGVRTIEAQSEQHAAATADDAWLEAVKSVSVKTGIPWLDIANGIIRPELAQIAILLIVCNAFWPERVVLTGLVGELVCGILGLFIGGRISNTGR